MFRIRAAGSASPRRLPGCDPNLEALEDAAAHRRDGGSADAELGADLRVGATLDDQVQHVTFALGQVSAMVGDILLRISCAATRGLSGTPPVTAERMPANSTSGSTSFMR